MCGIVGHLWYKNPVNVGDLPSMTGSLSHQGLDDQGIYLNWQDGGDKSQSISERDSSCP